MATIEIEIDWLDKQIKENREAIVICKERGYEDNIDVHLNLAIAYEEIKKMGENHE